MVMPIKVFFCYAHEDKALLKQLKTHLQPLEHEGFISVWYDRNISAGTEWAKAISNQLNVAQIILLLISPDFMASDYCYSIEMKRAMEMHKRGEARVIPVILRPAFWLVEPLKKLQALPDDAKPAISNNWHNLDEALVNVTEGIRNVAIELARTCDLLFYNPLEGKGEFYSIDDQGSYNLLKQHQWQKIWTQIIPGKFTDSKYTDLLFYSASTGEGEIYTTDGHGEIHSLRKHAGTSKDWKHIIPGNFTDDKYTDLLFHSPSKGRAKICTTDGRGGINTLKEHSNWQKYSTQVIYLKSV